MSPLQNPKPFVPDILPVFKGDVLDQNRSYNSLLSKHQKNDLKVYHFSSFLGGIRTTRIDLKLCKIEKDIPMIINKRLIC